MTYEHLALSIKGRRASQYHRKRYEVRETESYEVVGMGRDVCEQHAVESSQMTEDQCKH